MNKNYLIIGTIIFGIVVVGFGGFFYMNRGQNDNDSMITDELSTEKILEDNSMTGDENMEENKMMTEDNSAYVEYSSGILDSTSDSKRVLFFYASWCPLCRPVDTELKEKTDQIPEDLKIIRVNFNDPDTDDEEKALAKKYDVTYQHTFVLIDENGNEITKWSGGGLDEILTNVK